MINVTKTSLPSLALYNKYLKQIWKTNWVTNDGILVKTLERDLKKLLKSELVLVNNGTSGLQLALKALHLKGEVITTPFTFAATTNVLLWEGLTPIFADIDKDTFNIDPVDVEKKITNKTSAILAVHVYGNPCEMERLNEIAKEHNLKLIYDAAHAFNVEYKKKSILEYGDVSVLSFHATKTFHTIEGGAVASKSKNLLNQIKLYRNFGIKSEEEVVLPGINAKMNEFQAAMGLCNLINFNKATIKRKKIYDQYLKNLAGKVGFQKMISTKHNYTYMPVLFEKKSLRDTVYKKLLDNEIHSRKYFYPITSSFPFLKNKKNDCDTARDISKRILSLPIYETLNQFQVNKICKLILAEI